MSRRKSSDELLGIPAIRIDAPPVRARATRAKRFPAVAWLLKLAGEVDGSGPSWFESSDLEVRGSVSRHGEITYQAVLGRFSSDEGHATGEAALVALLAHLEHAAQVRS